MGNICSCRVFPEDTQGKTSRHTESKSANVLSSKKRSLCNILRKLYPRCTRTPKHRESEDPEYVLNADKACGSSKVMPENEPSRAFQEEEENPKLIKVQSRKSRLISGMIRKLFRKKGAVVTTAEKSSSITEEIGDGKGIKIDHDLASVHSEDSIDMDETDEVNFQSGNELQDDSTSVKSLKSVEGTSETAMPERDLVGPPRSAWEDTRVTEM